MKFGSAISRRDKDAGKSYRSGIAGFSIRHWLGDLAGAFDKALRQRA
jgi:hypothetical protein